MSDGAPAGGSIAPSVGWTLVTDSPLKGLAMARETGTILAWDEAHQVLLLDAGGGRKAVSRAPGPIVSAAASDDGSLFVLLGQGGQLWLLGDGLEPIAERATGMDVATMAVDSLGRYIALAAKGGPHAFLSRHGKPAGRFETRPHIAHLAFLADAPILIAAAPFGSLLAIELESRGGRLEGQVLWQQSLLSNVGRIALTGDGRMILASCYTHGIQRFDLEGNAEGSYHLGGAATHAIPDFVGRTIAVATTEGDLVLLNNAGNVRWQTTLSRPAVALQVDALGRYLIYGQASGEITRLDLVASTGATDRPRRARPAPRAATGGGPLRQPDWVRPIAPSEEEAEFAVLAVLDDPPRIGYTSTPNRLQVFTAEGTSLGLTPAVSGVGRTLRTAPGWIALSTDRHVLLYDALRNGAQKADVSLYDLTHVVLRPETFGLALVQERDRIGRLTPGGKWIWKKELRGPIEEIALDADDRLAATMDEGRILLFDPEGEPREVALAGAQEPCLLIEAPESSPEEVSWLVLARRAQWVRGLDAEGVVRWEVRLPFEAWQLLRVGPTAVITAPDGRALAVDGAGKVRAQSRDGEPQSQFVPGPRGEPLRVVRQGVHLICSELGGNVRWRAVSDQPLGPMAVGRAGVAIMIGRDLGWFSASPQS